MQYNELKIRVGKDDLDWLEAELVDHGCVSMMIDDPADVQDILDHPDTYRYDYINEEITEDMTRQPVVTLYFEDTDGGRADLAKATELLVSLGGAVADAEVAISSGTGLVYWVVSAGDDSEWLYKWQEYFKPARVGSRIVVKPSWEEYTPEEDDLVIEMDPGMAFGSGLHETTSMCIRALEKALVPVSGTKMVGAGCGNEEISAGCGAKTVDSYCLSGAHDKGGRIRVLDVGCGTGILAIASVMLGADEALAVDIDPDAVRVAEENIRHNGLADKITAQYGDLTEGIDYEADIIAANLMADLVIRLSPAAARHVRKGGIYITSGILDIKEDVVSEAIRDAGFTIVEVLHDGEWCAIVARR